MTNDLERLRRFRRDMPIYILLGGMAGSAIMGLLAMAGVMLGVLSMGEGG